MNKQALIEWLETNQELNWTYEPGTGEVVEEIISEIQSGTFDDDRDRWTIKNYEHNRKLLQSEKAKLQQENESLTQKLNDYEGCKGVEEYYTVLCKLRESQKEIERLRKLYEREREINEQQQTASERCQANWDEPEKFLCPECKEYTSDYDERITCCVGCAIKVLEQSSNT